MFFVTQVWVKSAFKTLGVKVHRIIQEGNTTVVEYCSGSELKTVEITPCPTEALTIENLKKKIDP